MTKPFDLGEACTKDKPCTLPNIYCCSPNCDYARERDRKRSKVPKTVSLPVLPEHMEYVARPKTGYLSNGEKCCDGICDHSCMR